MAAKYGAMPVGRDEPTYHPGDARWAELLLIGETIHVHDLAAEIETEFPQYETHELGIAPSLATPLLREGVPIGLIFIRRTEVRPFSEKQISSA